jgi:hypothetical protein
MKLSLRNSQFSYFVFSVSDMSLSSIEKQPVSKSSKSVGSDSKKTSKTTGNDYLKTSKTIGNDYLKTSKTIGNDYLKTSKTVGNDYSKTIVNDVESHPQCPLHCNSDGESKQKFFVDKQTNKQTDKQINKQTHKNKRRKIFNDNYVNARQKKGKKQLINLNNFIHMLLCRGFSIQIGIKIRMAGLSLAVLDRWPMFRDDR